MSEPKQGIAVIAGVGPGLGAALARKFAREGCAVALLARSADFLNVLAEELCRSGVSALSLPTDLTDANAWPRRFPRQDRAWAGLHPVNHVGSGV